MIVRIDKPGHDQPSGCIDDLVHDVGCKIGTNRKYFVVFDQDISDRRLMDIALMVVDLAASDQRSFRRHLCLILRSSAPFETTCARRVSRDSRILHFARIRTKENLPAKECFDPK
jgi:hypothetical protein